MRREGPDQSAGREGSDGSPDATGQVQEPTGRAQDQPTDQVHLRELQRARQARVAKVLVALFLLVVLIIFVIANSDPVPVHFVFLTRHPRLIWVMIACSVLGGVVGYLIGRPGSQVRLRRRPADDRQKDRR
jgi:uncharacterized integral membrane protein